MKHLLCHLLPAILLLYSCAEKDNKEPDKDSCYSNANAQTIAHDGEDREYVLYIPDSYDASVPTPLVLNFHGFGGSADGHMLNADMRPLAESDTFILVYPQGSCLDGSSHWNPCPPGGDNKSDADDFGFVEAMIQHIALDYNVDMERIYAAGYSNGSMMAYGLANFKSDLIAAVASVSGVMLDCPGPTNHPMPVLHLHGTSDGTIPYDGSSDYSSAQAVLDYWIDFNNADETPTLTSDSNGGITIEHYVYGQGDNSVSVEHYKYIGGEHVWFKATFQGQNTGQLIWDFVSKYDVNGLR